MKAYIVSVVVVGIIGAIIRLLSPDGDGGGLKNHVKLATGIAIIPICIFPLLTFIDGVKDFDAEAIIGELEDEKMQEYESIFEEGYLSAEEDNLREGIAEILRSRYGIEKADCYVSVNISTESGGERRLERIFINLYGSAIWKDTASIEEYLSALFACEVVIAVG